MKTVLCYGDSNTWGSRPDNGERFAPHERWTGVLRAALGDGVMVVEEGLGGRTTVRDDPVEEYRNGKTTLMPCLLSHRPLDLVVLMLGTNDLKRRFNLTAHEIALGVEVLGRMILASGTGPGGTPPRLLVVAPPLLGRLGAAGNFIEVFAGGAETALGLAKHYRAVAEGLGAGFLDAGQMIRSSDVDGIHWEADAHAAFGAAVAPVVRRMLAD